MVVVEDKDIIIRGKIHKPAINSLAIINRVVRHIRIFSHNE